VFTNFVKTPKNTAYKPLEKPKAVSTRNKSKSLKVKHAVSPRSNTMRYNKSLLEDIKNKKKVSETEGRRTLIETSEENSITSESYR